MSRKHSFGNFLKHYGEEAPKRPATVWACPACNRVRGNRQFKPGVYECAACGVIFTPRGGTIYLGESYDLVLPYFADEEVAPEQLRYYDLMVLGSKGMERRHGGRSQFKGNILRFAPPI